MSEKNNTPFSQQIAYISKGTFDAEATEILAKLVKAVRETGKKGSVSITLSASMLNTRDENAIRILPTIKSSIPELGHGDTIMFSTHDGDLLRDDPDQIQMDLRVVNMQSTAAPIKTDTTPPAAPIKLAQQG